MRNRHNRCCEFHVPAEMVFNGDPQLMRIMSKSLVVECRYMLGQDPVTDRFQYVIYSDLLPEAESGLKPLMQLQEVSDHIERLLNTPIEERRPSLSRNVHVSPKGQPENDLTITINGMSFYFPKSVILKEDC